MHTTGKPTAVQGHHVTLYKRALHPELFQVRQRRTLNHGTYELEAWLMHAGHMLRFQHRSLICCELVCDAEPGLPTSGAVATFPCLGEKDYEHPFKDAGVTYITSMTTETLSDNLYRATYNEMLAYAEETDALCVAWEGGEGGRNLSVLALTRYGKEAHAESYHLVASSGLVLRTQTIFEHR
jgi:hypothetical protein